MEPRTRYYSYLLAGIVMLIAPVADHVKGASSGWSLLGFEIAPILGAALFFAIAMKAKKEIPRHR